MVTVVDVLTDERGTILERAAAALERSHQRHYEVAGPAISKDRLAELLALTVSTIRERDLIPMVEHSTQVAIDRFEAGFDISEVQCAFNVLEEAIWERIVAVTPAEQLAESVGMVGTALGAGRDALARTYVSSAAHHHVPSLDLRALFRGGT